MTAHELDELMVFHWPRVMRRAMAQDGDEWLKGFVRSIARHAKRAAWRPTFKQAQLMRRLVAELSDGPEPDLFEEREG